MNSPRILVVGSLVMDLIIETQVFPASGETVIGETFQTAAGGKGANQAVQAARLGGNVTMVGKVGADAFGDQLLASVAASGVDVSRVLRNDRVSSAVGNVLLEVQPGKSTKNRIIVVPGANMTIQKEELAFLTDTIKQYDLVMMQLEIPMEIVEYVADLAYQNHVPVMLNAAPAAPLSDDLLSKLAYISPNEHEAAALTGLPMDGEDPDTRTAQVKAASRALLNKGVKNVIITLGSNGCSFMNEEEFHLLPCVDAGKVADPTAAGDSFVGAFCYHHALYGDNAAALLFANKTASVTVTKMGAQPSLPTMTQLQTIYGEDVAQHGN